MLLRGQSHNLQERFNRIIFSVFFAVLPLVAIGFVGYILHAGFGTDLKPAEAAVGVNKMISYQAKMTDAAGITVPNGTYLLTIRIYDSASAGTCLYTASGTSCGVATSTPVTVTNGIFSVMIGDTTSQNALTLDFNSDTYYLGIQVGNDSEMTPRKRIGAAGYAINSDTLDGYNTSLVGGSTSFVPVTNSAGDLFLTSRYLTSSTVYASGSGTSTLAQNVVLGNTSADIVTINAGQINPGATTSTSLGKITIDSDADLTFSAAADGDYLGTSVASAGDVNGDGYDDVIAGAHWADGGGTDKGQAYIYFGGPNMDNVADVTMSGENDSDYFGTSVAGVGDVNGDGYDDVLVGATYADAGGTNRGKAYLFYGGPSMNNVADVVFSGEADSDSFANWVSQAGDLNHDGYRDFAIGASNYGLTNTGRVYVYFGGPNISNTPSLTIDSAFDYQIGRTVAGVGDVNGDGYDDLLVGAHQNGGDRTGHAFLYFGGVNMDNVADITFDGETTDNIFGTDVAGAGDVNGDGFDDIIIGAPGADNNGSNSGRAYIYYGGPAIDNIPDVTMTGGGVDYDLGDAVASLGDINGDGYADVIVGAWGALSSRGQAYIYYGGANMDSTADVTFTGEASFTIGNNFGTAISSAGDTNGDGFREVIVGSNMANAGGSWRGRAYIYRATGLSWSSVVSNALYAPLGMRTPNTIYGDKRISTKSLFEISTPNWHISRTGTSTFTGLNVAGNVGIGTSTPAYPLDVNGFINTDAVSGGYKQGGDTILSASSTNYGLFAGIGAGANIRAVGLYNTFLGYQAGYSATSTDEETYIGYRAGYNATSTYGHNTFIGYLSGTADTQGWNNTAIGAYSLQNNTIGNSNAVVGTFALSNNTTGDSNVGVGQSIMLFNTTGSGNTGIGNGALFYNTSGPGNIGIGWTASYQNVSATNTIAIGYAAGRGTGLYHNQNGLYLGYQAGYTLQTGSDNNILIGYQAGDALTTGSGNILIGYDIDAPAGVSSSGTLSIGNLIYGTNLDGTGTTLSSGNIGISTSSPIAKLTVAGGAVLFNGTTGGTPISGAGTRMMWIPAKGAFRAGNVFSTSWDDGNIGNYSLASGYSTTASGNVSTAMGSVATASGQTAVAIGDYVTASGDYSTALGKGGTASGNNSFAMGENVIASGSHAFAIGDSSIASGDGLSFSVGFGTRASGNASFSFGNYSTASGDNSIALGMYVSSTANNSITIGSGVTLDTAVLTNSTANSLAVGFNSTVPTLMVTGGSGAGTYGNVGIATSSPIAKLTVADGAVLFDGGTGATPISGAGTRMMWIPEKYAFRAGYVNGAQWDDGNIGNYSFATGRNNTASGIYSIAMGYGSTASVGYNIAMGEASVANAYNSTAIGYHALASGSTAVSIGGSTTASGSNAVAMGYYTVASGNFSTALGSGSTASGNYGATALGNYTIASGNWGSTAMGYYTVASGTSAFAGGWNSYATGNSSLAFGDWATASGATSTAIGQFVSSTAANSMTFGSGASLDSPLVNSTANSLAIGFNSTVPTLMVTGGSGAGTYGSVAIATTTANSVAKLSVDGSVLFSGNSGATPISGPGTRLMWIPAKGAFRMGTIIDAGDGIVTQWDDSNIGTNSVAMGKNTIASGNYSTAMGIVTTASGGNSTAMGYNTIASGNYSTAMGQNTIASSDNAVATGLNTTASNNGTTAMNIGTTAKGIASTAMGYYTTASGDYSFALGMYVSSTATASITLGAGLGVSGSLPLVNSTANSLAVGFNSTVPTLMVTGGSGAGTYGKVGIGTSTPRETLSVVGEISNTLTDADLYLDMVGYDSIGQQLEDIAVSGDYAYAVDYNGQAFKIINISDPKNLKLVKSLPADSPYSIDVSYPYAYFSTWGAGGIQIYNISNPSSPSLVGSLSGLDAPISLQVIGRYLYFIDGGALYIVDVSNPASPKQISATTFGADSIASYVYGKYAYVTDRGTPDYLHIYDISNPVTPALVSSTEIDDSPSSIYVSGGRAYITNYNAHTLQIFDVSNPATPALLGTQNDVYSPTKVVVAGRYAYIGAYTGAGTIIDVSVASSTSVVGSLTANEGIAISGKYIYTTTGGGFFFTYEVPGIETAAAKIHSLETGMANVRDDLTVNGRVKINQGLNVGLGGIYSAGPLAVGIASSTQTNPLSASFLGNVGIGTGAPLEKLTIGGTTSTFSNVNIALGDGSTTTTLGFATSTYIYAHPKSDTSGYSAFTINTTSTLSNAQIFTVRNNGAAVLSVGASNIGIGTSTPRAKLHIAGGSILQESYADPIVVSSFTDNATFSGARGIYVSGKYAYETAISANRLIILDISNPASSTIVGSVSDAEYLTEPYAVYVAGKYAYVAANATSSITIVDVSRPSAPYVVGSVKDNTNLVDIQDIYVSGKYAYAISNSQNRFTVVDISNPVSPVVVASLKDDTNIPTPYQFYIQGKYAYVASVNHLTVIDISNPLAPSVAGSLLDAVNLSSADDVYVSGKYAYVTASYRVVVVDISNPTAMSIAGSLYDTTNLVAPQDIKVSGNYAYVVTDDDRVTVIDISNPKLPIVAGNIKDGSGLYFARRIFISGKYAYVTKSGGLAILDIGGILSPAANIGDISTSRITITDNADIGNDLYIQGGLVVGTGFMVNATSTTSTISGNFSVNGTLKIGTASSYITDSAGEMKLAASAGKFSFKNLAGSDLFTIDAAGNTTSTGVFASANSGTSTFAGGIQLTSGCFKDATGACLGGSLPAGATNNTMRHTGTGWATSTFMLNDDTHVSIGTTELTHALRVAGDVVFENQRTLIFGNGVGSLSLNGTATGYGSIAFNSIARGMNSVAFGSSANAKENYSIAMGYVATASSTFATAMGYYTNALGSDSFAAGDTTTASGATSTVFGQNMIVSGDGSFGVNLASTAQTLSAANTMAIMGGSVGIGNLAPSEKLTIGSGFIALGNGTTTTTLKYGAAGSVTSTIAGNLAVSGGFAANCGTGCVDIAEIFSASELVESGDLVMMDIAANELLDSHGVLADSHGYDVVVKKTNAGYASNIVGVVSTNPGVTLTGSETQIGNNAVSETMNPPVALAGRVPVKVTDENGPVKAGDLLVSSSSTPGAAMRFDPTTDYRLQTTDGSGSPSSVVRSPVAIIGMALTDFDYTNGQTGLEPEKNKEFQIEVYSVTGEAGIQTVHQGKVLVLIKNNYIQSSGISADGLGLSVSDDGKLLSTRDLDMGGKELFNVKAISSANGSWSIDENGQVTAKKVTAEEYEIDARKYGEADATLGRATVPVGMNEILVNNNRVKKNSNIVITFYGNPGGTWWISNQEDGWFKVTLSVATGSNVDFRYWIQSVIEDATTDLSSTDNTDDQLLTAAAAAALVAPESPQSDSVPGDSVASSTSTTGDQLTATTSPEVTTSGEVVAQSSNDLDAPSSSTPPSTP